MPVRILTRRLLAALFALWFAVVATEGQRVHACAMHGGGTATAGAAHGGEHGHDAAQQHGQESGHRCTCPGTSCGTGVVAMAAPCLTTHFAIAVADVRAVFSPASGHRPVAVPYLTPFANGPPAGALA
jgi:hypothetical protein